MQRDDPIGELERTLDDFALAKVAIHVRTRQGHDQGPSRILQTKTLHGRRASPGMQGHQEIDELSVVALRENHVVAQLAEDPRPALGGYAVPLP